MSYQQPPPQPGWAQPQQPAWGPPPPAPQPPKKAGGKIAAIGCLSSLAFLILIVIVAALADGSNDKPETKAPPYKVVEQDDTGHKRNVVVEVETTKNLRAVFDAVANDLTDEAGYSIIINCSTGGTKDLDNRLANGQKAVGNMGAATTGLKAGGTEFSTNAGQKCPVSAADKAKDEADRKAAQKAAGIPPEPTGADRRRLLATLAAVAPDVVRYEDKAVEAARNQCSAINGGSHRLNWVASQRFTYKDVTTSEAQGAKINGALKRSGFCKV
ncbi:hypothetical protein [Streptomyces spinosisporus]|uniref:Uncharacterized protein n=1 Tax=Streptomyces spinosisporus TaxID=2927582 RepID=A0ABS9XF78_9ACTN|nr:hypothetical protein [Streptomyces spinosisporus]MCI3240277.1 hypothetical protein [Streptomyces spinosisporus]